MNMLDIRRKIDQWGKMLDHGVQHDLDENLYACAVEVLKQMQATLIDLELEAMRGARP